MRREGLAPAFAALALLMGCDMGHESEQGADADAYRAYLAEFRPFGVERVCSAAPPRIERVGGLPIPSGGVQLWLSSPVRQGVNRYVATFPGNPCSIVLQHEAANRMGFEEPWAFRLSLPQPPDHAPGYVPPPVPDAYEGVLTSVPLEVAIRRQLLAECAAKGQDDCDGRADRWLDSQTLSIAFSPADLEAWPSSLGGSRDVVTLDLVDGRAYWEGEPL